MYPPGTSPPQPIAITGMACRFPGGASSPSKLWDLCAAGQNGWSEIPKDRFDVESLYDASKERSGRVGHPADRLLLLFSLVTDDWKLELCPRRILSAGGYRAIRC